MRGGSRRGRTRATSVIVGMWPPLTACLNGQCYMSGLVEGDMAAGGEVDGCSNANQSIQMDSWGTAADEGADLMGNVMRSPARI